MSAGDITRLAMGVVQGIAANGAQGLDSAEALTAHVAAAARSAESILATKFADSDIKAAVAMVAAELAASGQFKTTPDEVARAQHLGLRDAFVTMYCAQRGWNRADVSVDQLLEIRAQPQWQDPAAANRSSPEATQFTLLAAAVKNDWKSFVASHHPEARPFLKKAAGSLEAQQQIMAHFALNFDGELGRVVEDTASQKIFQIDYEDGAVRTCYRPAYGGWLLFGAQKV
jgi:hypothetical protein